MKHPDHPLPQSSFEAYETARAREFAGDLREILLHQNRDLYEVAKNRDLLVYLVRQWAEWRLSQCDADELSPEETQLLQQVTA